LRTAQAVAPARVVTVLYDELGDLPHFNPDDDVVPVNPAVARLRAAIHTADAASICTI
jgi:chromate reductase, NAD(P)H dehydrogenase (quinone)